MSEYAYSDPMPVQQAFIAPIAAIKRARDFDRAADLELTRGHISIAERLSTLAEEIRQQEAGGAR
jgi:hypothetical protein